MPHESQPLDDRSVLPVTRVRPGRLIVQSYVAAVLCVFALILDVWSRFDWETRHLATVRTAVGVYGLIVIVVCFARGALRPSDKWFVSFAALVCLVVGAPAVLMPRLIHN
jgi:hypothetical protein